MHSPVWISYDPGLEMIDFESDWELSADEYYDVGSKPPKNKRKGTAEEEQRRSHTKRRKLEPTEKIPAFRLDETVSVQSPVVWRSLSQRLGSPELPKLKEGETPKVALLRNWKAHLGAKSVDSPPSRPRGRPKKKSRKQSLPDRTSDYAGADGTLDDEIRLSASELPPTSLVEQSSTQPEERQTKAHVNRTSTIAKQAMRQTLEMKEHASPPDDQDLAAGLVEEDDDVSAENDMYEEGNGKLGYDEQDEKMSDGNPNRKASQQGKRKAEDSVEEPPPKKKRGRPKKAPDPSKAEAVPKAAGRKTRSKKS